MSWTFTNSPDTSTAQGRIDAVRILVGDIDTNNQKVQDETISFALNQSNNNIYYAGAISARTIAAKFAGFVDTEFDEISVNYSDIAKQYYDLANKLEKDGRTWGTGVPMPLAGGISLEEMEDNHENDDRPESYFRRRQFKVYEDHYDDDKGYEYDT